MWHLCQLQHHSCFTRLNTHTAASASPVFCFPPQVAPHLPIGQVSLMHFTTLFWVVRITDCVRSSSCALTSHNEQPPPGSRLCSWLPLPSAASDCTASLTKPLQMHLGHRHLSGGTTVKSRNWKKLARMLCPNYSKRPTVVPEPIATLQDAFGGESWSNGAKLWKIHTKLLGFRRASLLISCRNKRGFPFTTPLVHIMLCTVSLLCIAWPALWEITFPRDFLSQ